ncbi:peptide chain release factor N(5)-glutamine methyltransferase [Aureitalea sp. L0-47]|nr:peptide chain release factor N(5)-glutamine methyltransferase [Aureitalea sp. L0-47]MCW5519655.1 peptide chain release factor N(5)-glutamine methyltransferase [Aureitalea sp. L0-47]
MKVGELKVDFQNKLKGIFPSEEIESFFILLSEHWLGYSRFDLAIKSDTVISSEEIKKIEEAIRRLQKEEPIQYIIGSTEFYGLDLKVTPDTLIPRPETEELVDWIIKEHSGCKSVLDIGTGSGCIAISLAKNLPKTQVSAIDISEETLAVAGGNAEDHQADVEFLQLDILQATTLPETYDLIVSNPPYVREMEKKQMKDNVLKYEPATALFVPDHDPLLFYRRIVELSKPALNNQGWLLFEINEYLGEAMLSLLKDSGFENVELREDFRGKHRFIRGQYLKNDTAK